MSDDLLLAAAARAHPREACGVFVGAEPIEITNVAKKGTDFFIMDVDELLCVYNSAGDIDGVWHSHPDGDPNPSKWDLEYHPAGKRLVIVAGGKVHDHGRPG